MTTKQRIWAIPLIAIIIFAIGFLVTFARSSATEKTLARLQSRDYAEVVLVGELGYKLRELQDHLRSAVSSGDKQRLEDAQKAAGEFRGITAKLNALASSDESVKKLEQAFDVYSAAAIGAANAMLSDQADATDAALKMQEAQRNIEATLGSLRTESEADFIRDLAQAGEDVGSIVIINVIAALATIAGLLVAAWLVIRSIWGRLGGEPDYAAKVAGEVAAGNLAEEIRVEGQGHLLTAMRTMQGSLTELISGARHSAEAVAVAAGQISDGSADLAQRTEEQASSLEEAAATIEELTSAVRQNTDAARRANELSTESARFAERGGEVVAKVVTTMDDISAQAGKMVEITAMIDAIAFQTNILALNAAVEAARAGEQGRGFAVVATEVRSLAHRSAAAAKEIKGLLESSASRIHAGSSLAKEAGTSMHQIVESSRHVNNIMADIAAASSEQSDGIGQVNQAVMQLERMTHDNASVVQETAAAAESMRNQAAQLVDAMQVFRIRESAAPPVAAPRRHMAAQPVRGTHDRAHESAAPKLAPSVSGPGNPRLAGDADQWQEF